MTSSLSGIYNAQRSLLLNQAALDVVNNNVANMNTEGYSKQTVEISQITTNVSANASVYDAAQAGGGAQIDAITRSRDTYLDSYYRQENSTLSYDSKMSDLSTLVEDSTNELSDSGIMDSLNSFYTAAQNLSNAPTDSVARSEYVQSMVALSDKFNSTADQLTQLRTSLVGDPTDPSTLATSQISLTTEELNSKLSQLADLNKSIVLSTTQGTTPNGLLDTRDQILDDLSSYIPITVTQGANNIANVSMNGVSLVNGYNVEGSFSVITNPDPTEVDNNPAVVQILDKDGNVKVPDASKYITSGSMAAILDVGGNDSSTLNIKGIMTQLDQLASSFASTVNGIQLYNDASTTPATGSFCIDNSTTPATLKQATEALFYDDTNTTTNITAANIHVNSAIVSNPFEIATARGDMTAGVPDDNTATGDGSNVLLMAQVRSQKLLALGNTTAESFITAMQGEMGVKTESISNNLDSQQAVVDQISSRKTSATGVNLDEELVDLVKYQRAYEAASKIFSVSNEILQTIIAMAK